MSRRSDLIVGIDPGANGGICEIDATKLYSGHCFGMPDDLDELADYFNSLAERQRQGMSVMIYMERVSGYIGRPQPGSTMFNFGRSYGILFGCLHSHKLKYDLVLPKTWQRNVTELETLQEIKDFRTRQAARKRFIRAEAARRYPDFKVTLKTADAVMLADYGRRLP